MVLDPEIKTEANRASFLIEASKLLVSSLDSEQILQKLVRVALPRFAAWCCIDMVGPDGLVHRKTFAHSDPLVEERVKERQKQWPIKPNSFPIIVEVVRSGQTHLDNRLGDKFIAEMSRGRPDPALTEASGVGSILCVPLRIRNRVEGAVSFIAREFDRYNPSDVALVETLIGAAALAIENARLYEDSQRAVALRDEFLAIAAHELRTPLTTLKAHSHLFLMLLRKGELATLSTKEMIQLFEISDAEADRFTRLVNNLLDMSSILGDHIRLETETVDLLEVIDAVVERLASALRDSGYRLEVTGAPNSTGIWDRVRIDQVVTNLISNSLKHSGGKMIRINVDSHESHVRLRIRDDGVGIAAADRDRIFGRFERGDSGKSNKGLGLGLYIVRQIVEAHGGTAEVESEYGKGAVFTVILPTARNGASSSAATTSPG